MIIDRFRTGEAGRFQGLRLDKNERTSAFQKSFLDEIKDKINSQMLQAYPDMDSAYEVLSLYSGLSSQCLLLTDGIDAAIRIVFSAFCNPGDSIVVTTPSFAMVEVYAAQFRVRSKKVNFLEDGGLDVPAMYSGIDANTKLVIIANPSSPVGTSLPKEPLLMLIEKCEAYGVPLLIDEAYVEFADYSMIAEIETYSRVIIARTFSKAAGLAGVRLGFLAFNPSLYNSLHSYRPMYEISSFAVLMLETIYENRAEIEYHVTQTVKARSKLCDFFVRKGMKSLNTKTNFVHIGAGDRTQCLYQYLKQHSIWAKRNPEIPYLKNSIRISIPVDVELAHFTKVIDAF